MAKVKLNKYQRQALKGKEERVTGEEIWRLVRLADSPNVDDRLEAADNLCPCHVRRRIDEVWNALYRLLEDEDARVRRAAFHTLFDGGNLDDPALDEIFRRMLTTETHQKLRVQLEEQVNKREKAAAERTEISQMAIMAVGDYPKQGKCDFCGSDRAVRDDYDTHIPNGDGARPALVCESCVS